MSRTRSKDRARWGSTRPHWISRSAAAAQSASTRRRTPRLTAQTVQPGFTRLPTPVMAAAAVRSPRGITKISLAKATVRAARLSPAALLSAKAAVAQTRGIVRRAYQVGPSTKLRCRGHAPIVILANTRQIQMRNPARCAQLALTKACPSRRTVCHVMGGGTLQTQHRRRVLNVLSAHTPAPRHTHVMHVLQDRSPTH